MPNPTDADTSRPKSEDRYPPPKVFEPMDDIKKTLPSEDELADLVPLFTWGELKEIVKEGNGDKFERNQALNDKYKEWSDKMKEEWGDMATFMIEGRLPWSKRNRKNLRKELRRRVEKEEADWDDEGYSSSGSSNTVESDEMPESAAYVSLDEIKDRLDKDKDDEEHPDNDSYMRWDGHFDEARWALIANDWPYSMPPGVKHYCIWSRVPIVHPALVKYDEQAYDEIMDKGLHGFVGVTPVRGSYKDDIEAGGPELKKWAGVEHMAKGGQEIEKIVEALWDPRGWECLWFVNPPRLQSIPGFGHLHVLARRKPGDEQECSEGKDDSKGDDEVDKKVPDENQQGDAEGKQTGKEDKSDKGKNGDKEDDKKDDRNDKQSGKKDTEQNGQQDDKKNDKNDKKNDKSRK